MHCFCENWSDLKKRCDSLQWKILQPQKNSFFSSSSTPIQLYFQLTNTVGYSENFLWKTLQWKLRVTLLKSLTSRRYLKIYNNSQLKPASIFKDEKNQTLTWGLYNKTFYYHNNLYTNVCWSVCCHKFCLP